MPLSNRLLEQLRQITGNPLSEWRAYLLYGVVKNSERYYHKNGWLILIILFCVNATKAEKELNYENQA